MKTRAALISASFARNGFTALLLLKFYVMATLKVISGRGYTSDNAHLWQLYSAAPQGDQTTSTKT